MWVVRDIWPWVWNCLVSCLASRTSAFFVGWSRICWTCAHFLLIWSELNFTLPHYVLHSICHELPVPGFLGSLWESGRGCSAERCPGSRGGGEGRKEKLVEKGGDDEVQVILELGWDKGEKVRALGRWKAKYESTCERSRKLKVWEFIRSKWIAGEVRSTRVEGRAGE